MGHLRTLRTREGVRREGNETASVDAGVFLPIPMGDDYELWYNR